MNPGIIQPFGCKNCAHRQISNGQMVCAFNPPAAHPALSMNDKGQPVVLGWVSAFPSVTPQMKCGQHKFVAAYNDIPDAGGAPVKLVG